MIPRSCLIVLEICAKYLDISAKMGAKPILLRRESFFVEPEAPMTVRRVINQDSIPQHRHDFYEIVVIFSGRGVHVTGEFRHPLQEGDVIVVHHGRTHGFEETDHLNLVNLLVGQEIVDSLRGDFNENPGFRALFSAEVKRWRRSSFTGYLQLERGELSQIEGWLASMERELARRKREGRRMAEAYLSLIIGLLSRKERRGAPVRRRGKRHPIGPVLTWMETHYREALTVSELAQKAGYSERSFQRIFKESVGISPIRYLNEVRLHHALMTLQSPQERRSITEIAAESGFEDSNYFSRVFREFTGLSPKAFRAARIQTKACSTNVSFVHRVSDFPSLGTH